MSKLKTIVLGLVALLSTAPILAAGQTPPKLDHHPEIVIIGNGDMMDALERAVEDEVAIINQDGGVMGWPLVVTREPAPCDPRAADAMATRDQAIAERHPILVLQSYCFASGDKSVAAFADRNILYMGVGAWPAKLTEQRPGPSVFRLAPNYREAQEIAFNIATRDETTIWQRFERPHMDRVVAGLADDHLLEETKSELIRGFLASPEEETRWGQLVPPEANKRHVVGDKPPMSPQELS